jgi:hypothetical protein
MLNIQRFLGFTDNIKEPRKTKVENELSRYYSYKGDVYNTVSFLCVKLLEGSTLKKEENYQYYKRNGELSKPKTLYKYVSPNSETYFELNKTQYDFVEYLINNGLDTEEKMIAFDNVDVEKIEAAKKAEQETEKRRIEEERRREEEKENFKRWLVEESEKIPQLQKDIINDVFLAIYGEENCWNYSLAVCINWYDKPLCKEEVKARLHNDNKASIKIFECLTGLKLPRGYKERMEYLDSITSADFNEPKDYKSRKKSHKSEVELSEFYIIETGMENGKRNYRWVKAVGEPVEEYGVPMFVQNHNGNYILTVVENGIKVASGKSKTDCMNNLKCFVDKIGKEQLISKIAEATEMVTKNAGRNPLYNVI